MRTVSVPVGLAVTAALFMGWGSPVQAQPQDMVVALQSLPRVEELSQVTLSMELTEDRFLEDSLDLSLEVPLEVRSQRSRPQAPVSPFASEPPFSSEALSPALDLFYLARW
ncbi:MAG: hypothetical protein HC921_09920 [Synechococcaceae cyanobacterium SM2_3_1]|nr:hypothetical protein [Synechococcaceae cyanobacterium SM2_3_1]